MNHNTNKITFVNQYVNHLFVDIINEFAIKGYQVSLVTGGIYCDKSRLNEEVKVTFLNEYKRNNSVSRVFSWSIFSFLSLILILFKKEETLVVSSNPPFLMPLLSHSGLIRNKNLHLVIYDLYPEALINFGYINKESVIGEKWRKMNRQLFMKSDSIITISNTLRNKINQYIPSEQTHKVHNIPVWSDDDSIRPIPKHKNSFISKHGLKGKFVVLYSGNFGLTHDIETILEAAKHLKDLEEIVFLFIGDGAKKSTIQRFKKSNKLENIVLLSWQSQETLSYSLSSADIGIITLTKNAEAVSLPSKTFSYMKAGVGMIAISETDSELAHVLDYYKCGVCVSTAVQLTECILKLKNEIDDLSRMSKNSLVASGDFSSRNAYSYFQIIHNFSSRI